MNDPVAEEDLFDANAGKERDLPTSSHGASNSVLALHFGTMVQHQFNFLDAINLQATCSFILIIDDDHYNAPEDRH